MIRARPGFIPANATIQPLLAPPIGGGIVRAFGGGHAVGNAFYNNASSNPNHFLGQPGIPEQPAPPSPGMVRPANAPTAPQILDSLRARAAAISQQPKRGRAPRTR